MSGCCGDLSARRRGRRRSTGGISVLLAACDRQSDPELRLPRPGGKPDAGDAGCGVLLSPLNAVVGFYVPLPGDAGWARGIGEVLRQPTITWSARTCSPPMIAPRRSTAFKIANYV